MSDPDESPQEEVAGIQAWQYQVEESEDKRGVGVQRLFNWRGDQG